MSKPWWKQWEEIKDRPPPEELKPLAEYMLQGLKALGNLPRLPFKGDK